MDISTQTPDFSSDLMPADRATGFDETVSTKRLKIMFFPLGWVLAHTSRCVEIAKALRDRGHDVYFAGDVSGHPRSKLGLATQAGFPLVPAREADHPYAWDRYVKYGWIAPAYDLTRLGKWAPLSEILDDHVQVIQRHSPDLVVGDASVTVSTAAYINEIPAAGIMNAYASHFLTSKSAFHPLLLAYDRLHLARMRNEVYRRYQRKPVNALQLLRSIPLISPDHPCLYDPPSYFPNYHTVGPIWAEHPAPLPEWFGDLSDGKTNVYITMGSTGLLDEFLRRTYDDLGRLPYRFIVTTGGQVSEDTKKQAPQNFRITTFAPGSEILKHCKAVIFHGGNGTMYQALAAGVPMLSLPSHLEQVRMTNIAVRHGFCIKMNGRFFRRASLVRNLERLLNEPGYHEAAQRLAQPIRESNGAARAAEVLEHVALEGTPAGATLAK